jgi:hypothetical protein
VNPAVGEEVTIVSPTDLREAPAQDVTRRDFAILRATLQVSGKCNIGSTRTILVPTQRLAQAQQNAGAGQ